MRLPMHLMRTVPAHVGRAMVARSPPRHLMLGVIAESSDWRKRGFDGPHHLAQAAEAAGTSLTRIGSVLLKQ